MERLSWLPLLAYYTLKTVYLCIRRRASHYLYHKLRGLLMFAIMCVFFWGGVAIAQFQAADITICRPLPLQIWHVMPKAT